MSTLDFLHTENGKIDNIADIMAYSRDFYKSLYSSS